MLTLRRFYPGGLPRAWQLAAEGMGVAIVGTAFASWLFPAESSIVAVFLASILTSDSTERVLDWNRRAIFEEHLAPVRANARLVALMVAMFAGTVLGYSLLALTMPLDAVATTFSHQLADYGATSFPALRFGSAFAIFSSNVYVLLFFFVLAIGFRQGGVMLAVAWNASVWGATFGVLARRWTLADGPSLPDAYARVVAAVLPHLLTEAFAYVLAGFAGVFLSKGLVRHGLDSDVTVSILKTVAAMIGLGTLLILAGALWEGLVAGLLVAMLVPG